MRLKNRGDKDRNAKADFAECRKNEVDLQAGVRLPPPIDAFVRLKNKKPIGLGKPVFQRENEGEKPEKPVSPGFARFGGRGPIITVKSAQNI